MIAIENHVFPNYCNQIINQITKFILRKYLSILSQPFRKKWLKCGDIVLLLFLACYFYFYDCIVDK